MAHQQAIPASLALSPSQQAEVVQLIQAAGLDSAEFTWTVQPSHYHLIKLLVTTLVHTPTGASFRFDFIESALGQNRVSMFVPGDYYSREGRKAAASWEQQLGHVREWLTRLADAQKQSRRASPSCQEA